MKGRRRALGSARRKYHQNGWVLGGGLVKVKKMATISEYNYTVEIVTITADSSDGSVNLKPL